MSEAENKEPEDEELAISGPTESRKRAKYVNALDKLIKKLIERGELEMEDTAGIKTREIAYNLNMLIATREKLVERTAPSSTEKATTTANGLSREQAKELLRGHRTPPGS